MSDIKTEIINRELSLLEFNNRVLFEAERQENSLEERVRFLVIASENTDEFFSVRYARLLNSNSVKADCSGYNASQLIRVLQKKLNDFSERQYECAKSLFRLLEERGIYIIKRSCLDEVQQEFVYKYYKEVIKPNLGKCGNIKLLCADRIIDVPHNVPRLCRLPGERREIFILSEEVTAYGIMRDDEGVGSCIPIRFTRDKDFITNDGVDACAEVLKMTEKRKRGRIVRVEAEARGLRYSCGNICCVDGPMELSFMKELVKGEKCTAGRYERYENIFGAVRHRDIFLYHPYDSFKYVIDLINSAADDSAVTEIKQTIYRVSDNSPVIAALCRAAEGGKRVTVIVELKARFDEENNLKNAIRLERAGCKVVYGVKGLKTHCKVLRIVRREEDGTVAYVHLATGNYNEVTAKGYTDMGLITCREDLAKDTERLFKILEGEKAEKCSKLIISPEIMRKFLEEKIEAETENAKKNRPCGIFIKVNSLTDARIIRLLYRASAYGVPIKLLVRGACCLIPGKKNLSENIEVFSIVGRFLEHSRIFRFENDGNREILIGSADLMPRNLNRRIEVIFPIEDEDIKCRIDKQIEAMLADNVNLRIMDSEGKYKLREQKGEIRNSQKELYKI